VFYVFLLAQQFLQHTGPPLFLVKTDTAVGGVRGISTMAVGIGITEADNVLLHDFST
jgi:hypothetical protein